MEGKARKERKEGKEGKEGREEGERGASTVADAPPVEDELRSFLKQSLPDYMCPSVWMFMDKLPLTANGKGEALIGCLEGLLLAV